MSVQHRIRLSDDATTRLDEAMATTGRTKDAVIEAAVLEYLAACHKMRQALSQNETAVTPRPQVVEPTAVKDPLHGAKPGDTDEILALIRAVNELPASTELSGDLVFVNAERRATIHRQIAALRTAVAEART